MAARLIIRTVEVRVRAREGLLQHLGVSLVRMTARLDPSGEENRRLVWEKVNGMCEYIQFLQFTENEVRTQVQEDVTPNVCAKNATLFLCEQRWKRGESNKKPHAQVNALKPFCNHISILSSKIAVKTYNLYFYTVSHIHKVNKITLFPIFRNKSLQLLKKSFTLHKYAYSMLISNHLLVLLLAKTKSPITLSIIVLRYGAGSSAEAGHIPDSHRAQLTH